MYVYTAGLGSHRRRRMGMNAVTVDACTCVNNVCLENGNDCLTSSAAISSPLLGPTSASLVSGISNGMLFGLGAGLVGLLFLKAGR